MNAHQIWKPAEYDEQLSFVSLYGKGLLDLLAPQQGERILDLGCGTGDLACEISLAGAEVIGIDSSLEMILAARAKYPELTFLCEDGQYFDLEQPLDAVFSNAALHWLRDAENTAASIHRSLKPEGRFIAEFGGKGNIGSIASAVHQVLSTEYSIDAAARNPWYFPSLGEYSSLLEQTGFRVTFGLHFDRPTPLSGGENGLKQWLSHFGGNFFAGMEPNARQEAFQKISDLVKPLLWKDGAFHADYKRLRITALKI